MNRLEGRSVIVTGGGSGIGRGAVLRIAEEGGLVAIADIRPRLAEEVVEEVRQEGGTAISVACDVADETQVAAMVDTVVAAFGSLYGLVANAGTSREWVDPRNHAGTGTSCSA